MSPAFCGMGSIKYVILVTSVIFLSQYSSLFHKYSYCYAKSSIVRKNLQIDSTKFIIPLFNTLVLKNCAFKLEDIFSITGMSPPCPPNIIVVRALFHKLLHILNIPEICL